MPRQKKATALKLLDGNPGKTPIHDDELQPPLATAEPPEMLEGEGLEMWNDIAPELERLGMLNSFNRRPLALACQCWHRAQDAWRDEYTDTMVKASVEFRQWCAKFGFTPSDQAGIRVPGKEKKNPFEDFK